MAWHRRVLAICIVGSITAAAPAAQAFCGFYAGKADSALFNRASQVLLVRDGTRTTLTMQNDYRGEPSEFAMVVPVPTVLTRDRVRIVDRKIFDRLDAYSAPRLAEYFDPDPCAPPMPMAMASPLAEGARSGPSTAARDRALGVRVEQGFSVGEYDIVILSAEQSDGLETWLRESGYRLPAGAAAALAPYIRQDMKFFVAKVNLKQQASTGYRQLRPLQFSFDSARFMLPMRLGMLNADGPQDLVVYALTRHGRVESSNYRTIKLPANLELPTMLRRGTNFADFYRAMFEQQARRAEYRAVFTEYFWDMSWCDPCADEPLTGAELKTAGVGWLDRAGEALPGSAARQPANFAPRVMLTRLHLRYTPQSFPEDLLLQETADRQNFQARYVIRHPWQRVFTDCPKARTYRQELAQRQSREAATLADLTGWPIADIRRRQRALMPVPADDTGLPLPELQRQGG